MGAWLCCSPTLTPSAQGSQAAGASRSWCATYSRKGISDNCSYATQQQCLAQVWGLGGFCRPNPFPGTAYGTGYTWSSGPSRQTVAKLRIRRVSILEQTQTSA